MITKPLNLQNSLQPSSQRFDFIALFDVLLIAFGFSLLSSRFLFAPGITVELPRAGYGELSGMRTDAVLTVGANEMLLFEGAILNFDTFEGHLREYFEGKSDTALLIRADRSISMETLLAVAELARAAGVDRIQVAAVPAPAQEREFFESGR